MHHLRSSRTTVSGRIRCGSGRDIEVFQTAPRLGAASCSELTVNCQHHRPATWDLVVVQPRALSIVRCELVDSWLSRREYLLSVEGADPDAVGCDPDLEQTHYRQEQLAQAHVRAGGQAAGELARLLDAAAPRVLDQP